MKKLIILIALLIFSAGFAFSQDDDDTGGGGMKNTGIQVGALVGLKAGINTSDYPGYKNRPVVSSMPDLSIVAAYIFDHTSNTKLMLELGYQSYVFGYTHSPNENIKEYNGISCITIIPQFDFNVLNIGLAIGIPSSATHSTIIGSNSTDADVLTDGINTFIEGRVGFDVKVISSPTGDMMFYGRAGYLFNSAFATTDQDHIVSLTIGIGYMFNVPQ